jgi:DNA-binding transcriptional LysR family regulator
MDIRQLRYFKVCCQYLNFSKAARKCFISRQALTKDMHDLEKMLDAPLFIVNQGNLELTPFGQYFLKSCLPVLAEYDQFEQSINNWKSKEKNLVSIAVGLGVLSVISYKLFLEFQNQHPDIPVSLHEYSDQTVREMVRTDQVNLGIFSSSPEVLKEFEYYLIQRDAIYLQVNKNNPLTIKDSLELADLKGQPFVSLGTDNDMHNFFVEKCNQEGFEPNIVLITRDANVANEMVINNEAISFGHIQNEVMAQNSMIRIMMLRLKDTDVWGTYAIHTKGQPYTTGTEAVIRYFSERNAN